MSASSFTKLSATGGAVTTSPFGYGPFGAGPFGQNEDIIDPVVLTTWTNTQTK